MTLTSRIKRGHVVSVWKVDNVVYLKLASGKIIKKEVKHDI